MSCKKSENFLSCDSLSVSVCVRENSGSKSSPALAYLYKQGPPALLLSSSPRITFLLIHQHINVAQPCLDIHSKAHRRVFLSIPNNRNGAQESNRYLHGEEACRRACPPLLQRFVSRSLPLFQPLRVVACSLELFVSTDFHVFADMIKEALLTVRS